VKAPNWLRHVEFDWKRPLWRPWLEALASARRGGARAPPPSRSALGRSHKGNPHAKKKIFQAAGLDRRAAL
jgi:hypothetical protein